MCGIAGAAWADPGRATADERPGRDDRPGSRTAGRTTRAIYRDDHAALGFRRLCDRRPRGRPPAALERGRHGLDRLQRRDLQLPRACGAGSKPAATRSARTATPRSSSTSTRTRGPACSPCSGGCSPWRSGTPRVAGWSSAATGSARSRSSIATTAARIVFASELKALLALPEADVPRRVDPLALDRYLTYGYVPHPRTILEGVHKLPAGHFAVWHEGRLEPRPLLGPRLGPRERRCRRARTSSSSARRSATRSASRWWPTCRSGPSSRAGSTRRSSSA